METNRTQGDIFTLSAMGAAILVSNSINVTLLTKTKPGSTRRGRLFRDPKQTNLQQRFESNNNRKSKV